MQARLTALAPPHRLLTDNRGLLVLLVVNCTCLTSFNTNLKPHYGRVLAAESQEEILVN